MANDSVLRLNMTGLLEDRQAEALRYRAALDMAVYAEQQGFSAVGVEEHHCADNGWLPSPITMASMIAARTDRILINISALLVTLYDPVRLAEDIAVIDMVSGGRLSFIAGMGYRPVEYHAMDKSFEQRGALMDEVLETLLKAWSGEAFEYRGNTIRVTPTPVSEPHPIMFVGGMSKAAARRAARFGLPFYPPQEMPELEALYHSELEKHGKSGFVMYPEEQPMVFIDDDPERAWQELGPYFLREAQEYSSWRVDNVPRPAEEAVNNIDDVRRHGRYQIFTPDEYVERVKSRERITTIMHPLAGGVPVDRAWQLLRNYVEKVLPRL